MAANNRTEDRRKQNVVGVYFNDGCIRRAGYVGVAAKLKGIDGDEYEFSRTFTTRIEPDGSAAWGHRDLSGMDLVSLCHFSSVAYTEEEGWGGARFVALSTRGQVALTAKGLDPEMESIADAPDLGAMSQVRQIGGSLYACGYQGQVYRRDERKGWLHVDQGILDTTISPDALHLNGIDGTAANDIYVVGMSGRVLHFDGKRWTDLEAPTNLHLERVHCVSPTETYACGNQGTFLKITNGGITDLSIDLEEHFWGLTSFEGKVYLATLQGLHVYDGKRVSPVDTKLDPPIGGYRLDACETQLWSFGVDDLAFFDGKTWHRHVHPDNA